jgi:hypothetical protein
VFLWFVPQWLWMGLLLGIELTYLRTLWKLVSEIHSEQVDVIVER